MYQIKNNIYSLINSIIFFLLIIPCSSYSQFTIDNSYKPVVGDTLELISVDSAGVVFGTGGANQIWNYSNIQILSEISHERFVHSSSTPYYSQFPNSNIATVSSQFPPVYHYENTEGVDWLRYGYANTEYIETCSNPICIMHFPLSYGSQYSSPFTSTGYSGNTTYFLSGMRSFLGDGYGTLILPSKTFNNTLRIKIFYEIFDTVKIGGIVTFTQHIFITYYKWYSEGNKFPVFEIDEFTSDKAPYYFKNVFLGSRNPSVGIIKISEKIPDKFELKQNYPNPFNPSTNIRFQIPKNSFVTLKIFDILGKEIATLVNEKINAGEYEVPFISDKLTSGVYFFRIEAGDYVKTKKMLLIK